MQKQFVLSMILAVAIGAAPRAWAGHDDHTDHAHATGETSAGDQTGAPAVARNRLVVDVHGVVCSICAYGLEKRLSKLPALDRTQFKNGVLTDIYNHHVTLALQPDVPIDLRAVYRQIERGGYKSVALYLLLTGTLEEREGVYVVEHAQTGTVYEITGADLAGRVGTTVELPVHVDAGLLPALEPGGRLAATVVVPETQP